MYRLALFCLLMQGCRNPFSFRSRMPNLKFPCIDPETIEHDWATYFSWGGGLCIFFGIICLVWVSKKEIAIRLFAMGFVFMVVGRMMDFFSNHFGWIALVCVVFGILFNTDRVEKLLSKMGLDWDINGDKIIGTKRTGKPIDSQADPEPESLPDAEGIFDEDETAILPALDSTPADTDDFPLDDATKTEPTQPHTDTQ